MSPSRREFLALGVAGAGYLVATSDGGDDGLIGGGGGTVDKSPDFGGVDFGETSFGEDQ